MINREKQSVSVITFTPGTDAYGQKNKKGIAERRTVEMYIKIYNQAPVDDIRYTDVTDIGLTTDKLITDENEIEDENGIKYNILYVIPSSRYYQILMNQFIMEEFQS